MSNEKGGQSGLSQPAQVLVVDDDPLFRAKLNLAVEALGHQPHLASGGIEALAMLADTPADIILLDIVMPDLDGFAVLEQLKRDPALAGIPVIVVSTLENQKECVARAIRLGAIDFLPKEFEPAILRARITSCLMQKRLHEREQEDIRRFERLAGAAGIIEGGAFHPAELDLDDLASDTDPIGKLAHSFRRLAHQIHERERRQDLALRTVRGVLLLAGAGAAFGLAPALGRLAAETGAQVPATLFWSGLVGGLFCLLLGLIRSEFTRPDKQHIRFVVAWALVLGVGYQGALIAITSHVEASLVALVGSARAFIVFGLAALLALEAANLRRLAGLGVGFAAVAGVLVVEGLGGTAASVPWLASTLALPVLLAIHTLLMGKRPATLAVFPAVGAMLVVSTVFVALSSAASGAGFTLFAMPASAWLLVAALGVTTGLGLALGLEVVRTAGPVFGGQMAYTQCLAGIIWAMLLLGEAPPASTWVALALVVVGFWLVEPKRADDFRATLPRARLGVSARWPGTTDGSASPWSGSGTQTNE